MDFIVKNDYKIHSFFFGLKEIPQVVFIYLIYNTSCVKIEILIERKNIWKKKNNLNLPRN